MASIQFHNRPKKKMIKFAQLNTMLKTRIISMSILFLLIFGVTLNVHASDDSKLNDSKSTEKEHSDSDDDSEQEPQETISQLDFFGAFSLVNIQLHWRDLYIGINDDVTDKASDVTEKERVLEEVETLTLEVNEQIAPVSSIITTINNTIPIPAYRSIDGTTNFYCGQNTQRASTIAYIYYCGTHPLSC